MDENTGSKDVGIIKHDIKNQLSNITLSLEQLRFEIPEDSTDGRFYFDTILSSCKNINNLLNNL